MLQLPRQRRSQPGLDRSVVAERVESLLELPYDIVAPGRELSAQARNGESDLGLALDGIDAHGQVASGAQQTSGIERRPRSRQRVRLADQNVDEEAVLDGGAGISNRGAPASEMAGGFGESQRPAVTFGGDECPVSRAGGPLDVGGHGRGEVARQLGRRDITTAGQTVLQRQADALVQ